MFYFQCHDRIRKATGWSSTDCLDVLLHLIVARTQHKARLDLPVRTLPEGLLAALEDDLAALPAGDRYGDALLAVLDPGVRRSLGAFHTPDDVAQRIVAAAGLTSADVVLDPACGTGALLSAAAPSGAKLVGLDADPRTAALAGLNLPEATITHADALAAPLPAASVILTNPPFGRGREGRFVHRCLAALPRGGRLWAVLPRGLLTNRRSGDFLNDLDAEVLDRIELPSETFAASGTRIATVILGLKAGSSTETAANFAETAANFAEAPSDAALTPLSALCTTLRTGHTPSGAVYTEDGPFLLKVGNLTGRGIDWTPRGRNHVSAAWASRPKRVAVRRLDIALTAAGHRPKYAGLKVDLVVDLPSSGAVASGEVMILRPRPERIRPSRLWLWLRSPAGYAALQSVVRGQTAHLYGDDVGALQVDLDALVREIPDSLCDKAEELARDSAALAVRWTALPK